jgi:hypothetical protein
VLGTEDRMLDPGGQGHKGDQQDLEYGGYRPVDGSEHGTLLSRLIPFRAAGPPSPANQVDQGK